MGAASREQSPTREPSEAPSDLRKIQKDHVMFHNVLELLGRVTENDTVDGICRTIVEGVRNQLGFDRSGLFLWDEKTRSFRGTFGTTLDKTTTDEHDLFWYGDDWAPTKQIDAGATFIHGEKLDQPAARPGEENLRAELVVLRCREKVYGILSVDNRITRRVITEDDLRYLTLFSRILGNAVEISRAKAELSQSAERFRQVAENSREWIWEIDADGKYTYSSPVVQDILGYAPGEIAGRSCHDFVAEASREIVRNTLGKAVAEKSAIQRLINRQKHKSGREVVFETNCLPILDGDGRVRGYRGSNKDISFQVEMEERLRQAQKMEAIGRLAGGIAHYFNNLLTLIMGCSSLIIEQLGEDNPVCADLEQIKAAGEQAASLTKQLLAFSSKQVLNVKRLNSNAVLQDIERLLGRTLGEDIELVLRLDPQLAEVEADEDRLKYVVLHLVINARGAMTETAQHIKLSPIAGSGQWEVKPRQGRQQLIIATANIDVGKSECEKHPTLRPGRHIMISITDTGVGIPEEIKAHLFEPFLTTKEVGQGTGLGLSSIYGTWKQMGGEIMVESEFGKGTTFKLCLPATDPAIVPLARAGAAAQPGSETILLVEDDDSVREFTTRMLKTVGYRILSAPDGPKALELFKANGAQIDLVMTDMVMPNMTGKQFVEAVRQIDKKMNILFVSGYSPDDTTDETAFDKGIAFLQKPYTRDQLSKKIRDVLAGRAG